MPKGQTPQERFFAKVERDEAGCWIWQGHVMATGYGWFRLDATYRGSAHRAAWLLLRGPLAADQHIDHLCRVRACVNPDHLEPVTHLENHQRGEYRSRTTCSRGHDYTPENTYVDGRGRRDCKTCRVERDRVRGARLSAERRALRATAGAHLAHAAESGAAGDDSTGR